MRPPKFLLIGLLSLLVLPAVWSVGANENEQAKITLKNRTGNTIISLTDGDAVKLSFTLTNAAVQPTEVLFELAPGNKPIAKCTVPSGAKMCEAESIFALGWFWDEGGKSLAARTIRAVSAMTNVPVTTEIHVAPRPVVMVHGFMSAAATWDSYSKATGFLAPLGLTGFAVGDGKVEGVMNTGDTSRPIGRTNTIAENAAILGHYIANVKAATKAEMVDIVAHSMGGIISRYYIDRLMPQRDVAQLVMLGSPHGG